MDGPMSETQDLSMKYALNRLVWLKQPSYPWWPGVVIDAATTGLTAPEGRDVCVLCLPSSAATIAFASATDTQELRLFSGDDADAALVRDAAANAECAAAVQEAQELLARAAAATDSTNAAADVPVSIASPETTTLAAVTDEDGAGAATGAREGRRRDERRRRGHHRRPRSSSSSQQSHRSDSGSDQRPPRRRRARPPTDHDLRQSRLDEYEFEAAQPPRYEPEDDADYLYHQCRARRRAVDDATLLQCRDALHERIGLCLHTSAFEENEEPLLELLRQLSAYDVTLQQLCRTRIGVTVGQLLRRSFSCRVSQLAKAILTYWFQHLPAHVQQGFEEDTELDRCSVDTTAGERSEEGQQQAALGPVGVHVYESFTDEEIDDAPATTNVMELCKELENALRERNDGGDTCVMVLAELSNAACGPLRRALLEGKITVQEVVNNASDLQGLLRGFNRHGLRNIATSFGASAAMNSPTSPSSPGFGESEGVFSPTGRGTLGNLTTLYVCPNCGAKEAYRTVYTVQAHDHFPDILRCRRCDTTWNIAEQ